MLITRYLEYSLPYRLVLTRAVLPAPLTSSSTRSRELLVRLHLTGFFWGDCSLSNTLFRRDAGSSRRISSTLRPPSCTSSSRRASARTTSSSRGRTSPASCSTSADDATFELAADVLDRYDRLWSELTREEVFAGRAFPSAERLHRLNDLGFDVGGGRPAAHGPGFRLRLRSQVVEPGHHRRRLLRLTGLRAQENQARRLLEDIEVFRAELDGEGAGRSRRPHSRAAG